MALKTFSTLFQLYRRSQCTYPCLSTVSFTSTLRKNLSKPLAAFPQNHLQYNGLLTLYHTILTFPLQRSLLNTLWEKDKMLVNSIFSFSHNVFYPSQNTFQSFSHVYFIICTCFQVVWFRLNRVQYPIKMAIIDP